MITNEVSMCRPAARDALGVVQVGLIYAWLPAEELLDSLGGPAPTGPAEDHCQLL